MKLTNNDPVIIALKLADQWASDGSGSQGWQIKSALWRQTCDAYERSQAAVSFGFLCPSKDSADCKYGEQVLQAWNDLETGVVLF